jgi:hypothetical protein
MCSEKTPERRRLRGDGAERRFCFNSLVRYRRCFAAFYQIGEVLTDSLGVPKKLDTELVVFVPAHNGDFDGERSFYFRGLDVEREVASRSQGDVALHSAARDRKIEEYSFCRAVVRLDAGRISHMLSCATP